MQAGRGAQQGVRQLGARRDEVFARIHEQQQLAGAQVIDQGRQRLTSGLLAHGQHRGARLRDDRRIGDRAIFHQPDAVGELVHQVGRDLERQPRLARAAHPVRVTRRSATTRSRISATSRSRPMKRVVLTGRLLASASSDFNDGKLAGRLGCIS